MRSIILAAAAVFFLLPSVGHAAKRAPAGGAVTQFCGDRYGSCGGALATDMREPSRRHARGERQSRRQVRISRQASIEARPASGGLVTISTAAGSVTVAPSFAPKIQGFISDVVALGFSGRVHCYASGGHVRGSLHYRGEACDFAQRGWNKTVAVMYRVADLAARHGLRDGCTFRDCGHIDSGGRLARSRSVHRYASRRSARLHHATALPPAAW